MVDDPTAMPCVFCGHSDTASIHECLEGWYVRCSGCGAQTGTYECDEAALAAWSRRLAPPRALAALADYAREQVSDWEELSHHPNASVLKRHECTAKADAYTDMAERLESLAGREVAAPDEAPAWVSTSDRLPDHGRQVVVWLTNQPNGAYATGAAWDAQRRCFRVLGSMNLWGAAWVPFWRSVEAPGQAAAGAVERGAWLERERCAAIASEIAATWLAHSGDERQWPDEADRERFSDRSQVASSVARRIVDGGLDYALPARLRAADVDIRSEPPAPGHAAPREEDEHGE